MRLVNHILRWNRWRKNNTNGKLHKFLVLIGFRKSPTMAYVLTKKELKEIDTEYRKLFEREEL